MSSVETHLDGGHSLSPGSASLGNASAEESDWSMPLDLDDPPEDVDGPVSESIKADFQERARGEARADAEAVTAENGAPATVHGSASPSPATALGKRGHEETIQDPGQAKRHASQPADKVSATTSGAGSGAGGTGGGGGGTHGTGAGTGGGSTGGGTEGGAGGGGDGTHGAGTGTAGGSTAGGTASDEEDPGGGTVKVFYKNGA